MTVTIDNYKEHTCPLCNKQLWIQCSAQTYLPTGIETTYWICCIDMFKCPYSIQLGNINDKSSI